MNPIPWEEYVAEKSQNPHNYLPPKRKDDRQFPGIVLAWAGQPFKSSPVKWRVWNGYIDRENHHDKDPIYYFHQFIDDESDAVDGSSGLMVQYPPDMKQDPYEFIAWADSTAERIYKENKW